MSRRFLLIAAVAVLVGSGVLAILLPRFTCENGTRLQRDIPPPAGSPNGWVCMRGDVGYVPHDDGLPFKVGIAVVGALLAVTLTVRASGLKQ